MKIVIAGGSGFLGSALVGALAREGHEVVILTRRGSAPKTPHTGATTGTVSHRQWTADANIAGWGQVIDGCDVVVNLAGESIASGRWTPRQKSTLERSRLDATHGLVSAIGAAARPPQVLVSASAVGYYGSRGDEVLTEASTPGADFLAGLAVKWEAEARRAATRVALLRTGLVLDRRGGALQTMLMPFRLGLGGAAGPGTQYMAWIHKVDWIALVLWIISTGAEGPFNVVGPQPVTNRTFSSALGRALGRPVFMPAPALALRLALGEMADGLLLGSQRAVPERALARGFAFRFPSLDHALTDVLAAT